MFPTFSRNQWALVGLIPALVLAAGWLAFRWLGTIGLLVPIGLGFMVMAVLLLEFRAYTLRLFLRQQEAARHTYAQTEALMGILHTLRPVLPLPATRGWAAGPDLLRELVTQLRTIPADLVVEASSGVSTLVIAYCLKEQGRGQVIALEHDPVYAERTRRILRDHGVEQYATVVDTPLVSQQVNGRSMLWYDLRHAGIAGPIDLLVVDGPPDTTQPMARYPALPLLLPLLAPRARVLLDDGDRADERAAVQRWVKEDPGMAASYLNHEGGAWLLRRGYDR